MNQKLSSLFQKIKSEDFLWMSYFTVAVLYCFLPLTRQIPLYGRYLIYAFLFFTPPLYKLVKKQLTVKYCVMLGVVLVFICLYYLGKGKYYLDGAKFISYATGSYFFFFPLFAADILQENTKVSKYTKNIFFVVVFVSAITTIVGNYVYYFSSRILGSIGSGETFDLYTSHNIGGYGFTYAMVLLLPYFVYEAKYNLKKLNKGIYILFALVAFYVCVKTEYTIAVLLSLVLVLFILLYNPEKKWRFIIILVSAIVLFILLRKPIAKLIYLFNDFLRKIDLDYVATRFDDIAMLLSGNSAVEGRDLGTRFDLYTMSFQAFIQSPIWGNLFHYKALGGHSEFLDILGATGIIGFALYLYILISRFLVIKTANKNLKKYILTSFLGYALLNCINHGFGMEMGFVLFICPILFNTPDENHVPQLEQE